MLSDSEVIFIKPILYIDAFDASHKSVFKIYWQGNQSFGNILRIYKNQTNEMVYEQNQATMQLSHILPENTLTNGVLYNASVATIDIDGNASEYSDPILFYCFTTPTFVFDNVEENQIIKNSSYQVHMSYEQLEGELLQSWEIGLYDNSLNLIQTSSVSYTDNISYTITDLEDDQSYYLKAECVTLNGLKVDTGYIRIYVDYKQPAVYSILVLQNVNDGGYIKIKSNIRAVGAKSKKDVEYIDNEYVDLRDNTVFIDDDFSLNDDFIINLLGYNLIPNTLIMQLSDGINFINLYYKKGIYDANDNVEKTFIELNIPIGNTSYICFSNYIDNPLDTDILDIWLTKKNGLYSVYLYNKGE